MNPVQENQSKTLKINIWSVVGTAAWLVLLTLLVLKFFVYQQVTVVGASMEPNYYTGEILLVDQINKSFNRGQVVAVYEDKEVAKTADYWTRFQTRFFLKRVIGLPGEEIEMVGNKVIIYNSTYPEGRVIKEDYISEKVKNDEEITNYYFPKTKIEAGTYFLMGDNRTNSLDSREKGAFPEYSLFGKESIRFWPISTLGTFNLPAYSYEKIDSDLQIRLNNLRELQVKTSDLY